MITELVIKAIFKMRSQVDAIAWAGKIWTRQRYKLPAPLKAHELVHLDQQKDGKYTWLCRYLLSRKFRFKQEVPAHRAQIKAGADPYEVCMNFVHNYGFDYDLAQTWRLLND